MSIFPIKVGWDYDEPIHPWYDLSHVASIEAGIALPEHEPTSWAPHETYGCPIEDWFKVLDDEVLKGDGGMYMHPLDEHVKWQLHRLANAGLENHIVTARGSFGDLGHLVKDLTTRHIEREGLPVTSVHFSKTKSQVVNELRLDYFIDDAPHNYLDLVENTQAEIFLLNERWNQDLDVPDERRLDSIEEYVDIILDRHA